MAFSVVDVRTGSLPAGSGTDVAASDERTGIDMLRNGPVEREKSAHQGQSRQTQERSGREVRR